MFQGLLERILTTDFVSTDGQKKTTERLRRRDLPEAKAHAEGILQGDRILLSRAITLIESTRPEHQAIAQEVLEICLPHAGRSTRIGITGTPGVGKSTFIEAFGSWLTARQEHKVAVLAIDPTSRLSKGSILGDKTRMERLAADPRAFIRPSPAGESLGGVAARTREAMLLCEAAGYEVILIETVGVGQSEVAVHGMVDFFLLLLLPGAGDELQGIKRGIVEMADLIAINKADGERRELARYARREYNRALQLLPPKLGGWKPKVLTCSSLTGDGIPEIWQLISDYMSQAQQTGWLELHRRQQAKNWLFDLVKERLELRFMSHPAVQSNLQQIESEVLEGRISASHGAEVLLRLFDTPEALPR